jgi:putative ABC transport system permease protein
VFGLFSVMVGVLLIFLIFVMLAAERRPEMGISRAVGTKRRHLIQAFLAEGPPTRSSRPPSAPASACSSPGC